MAFAEEFTPFFADFGVDGTLAGTAVRLLKDVQTIDEGPGALTQQTDFLLMPGSGATPAPTQVLVAEGVNYAVRQVLAEPPDGALQRLVVVRT